MAVEAVRAGEAGKGFAVVAAEVRSLAQRSEEAAKDTSELIESSQDSSDRGVNVAVEVSENLRKIKVSVSSVGTLVDEIAAAASEQSNGIEEMSSVMREMDKAVQGNAANSEESASAAQELSSQATELNHIVYSLRGLVGGKSSEGSLMKQSELKKTFTGKKDFSRSPFKERNLANRPDRYYSNGARKSFDDYRSGFKNGNGHNGNGRSRQEVTAKRSSSQLEAQKFIPLDDDDLSDF